MLMASKGTGARVAVPSKGSSASLPRTSSSGKGGNRSHVPSKGGASSTMGAKAAVAFSSGKGDKKIATSSGKGGKKTAMSGSALHSAAAASGVAAYRYKKATSSKGGKGKGKATSLISKSAIETLSNGVIRTTARKGGVGRMSMDVNDVMRDKINAIGKNIIMTAFKLMESRKSKTLSENDFIYTIRLMAETRTETLGVSKDKDAEKKAREMKARREATPAGGA